jgi:uncharacterized membrane protein
MALSSQRVRERLVRLLGTNAFLGIYSVIALALFVPVVRIYFANKHAGPLLWSIPVGQPVRLAIYLGMAVAFVLMFAGLVRPSPGSIVPGNPTPRGAFRLTRHPLFMGLGLFGLLHLIPNGNAADAAFFAGFPLFALLGCWHQDRRKLVSGPAGFAGFYRETPFLPFTGAATLEGIRELGPIILLGGIGVTGLLRYCHPAWFGG